MSGHKALPIAQTCECCGAVVNLHSPFINQWDGHANHFYHNSCFKKMYDAEEPETPIKFEVSDDGE